MTVSALYSASSALQAFPQGMQSVAYNLTDINREGHMRTEFVESSSGSVAAHTEVIAPPMQDGYTDYASEFVRMISYENAHEANTKTIQTADDMLGVVVNMKV